MQDKYKELKFQNVDEVRAALGKLTPEDASLKESLLRCYILNLILYKQLDERHPIKKTLITLSVYIDLMEKAEKAETPAGSNIIQEAEEDLLLPEKEERRPINYTMEKNKIYTEKRTALNPEQRNPRIKNKRRYQDAHNLAEKVRKDHPKLHKR
ncbi:uncharacterized protein NEMAJ01_0821 [Nematocida major]|uniref:uncharacterized protein n=1 Tax=Nematocida major TaxID=1912982 RepID=UPI002008E5B8|nr:uncharacterized protein NEMAJ01_0821 [Nematocida major]KAH9385925.1 hypothetical protein NEMAJ01_0821 [Nematocida major]